MTRLGRTLVAVVLAVVPTVGLLAGCSDDDPGSAPEADASSSATATASETTSAPPEPTLPVPAGVELSAEGSQLQVGETATVAYEVGKGVVAVLEIKVTRLEATTLKKSFVGWDLDKAQRKSNPYFVRATVKNVGETDLGGRRVPLYIVDGTNTLVESSPLSSGFPICEPGSFPEKFAPGKKLRACLVYLAPEKGALTAVSFRPTQEFDPITWTGALEEPQPPEKKKDKPDDGG